MQISPPQKNFPKRNSVLSKSMRVTRITEEKSNNEEEESKDVATDKDSKAAGATTENN